MTKLELRKIQRLRRKSSGSGEIITTRILYLSSLLFSTVAFVVTASPRGVKSPHRPEAQPPGTGLGSTDEGWSLKFPLPGRFWMQKLTSCKHLLSSSPASPWHLSLEGLQTCSEWLTSTTKGFNQNSMRHIVLPRKTYMNTSPEVPAKRGEGGALWEVTRKSRVNKLRKVELDSLCKPNLHWQDSFVI